MTTITATTAMQTLSRQLRSALTSQLGLSPRRFQLAQRMLALDHTPQTQRGAAPDGDAVQDLAQIRVEAARARLAQAPAGQVSFDSRRQSADDSAPNCWAGDSNENGAARFFDGAADPGDRQAAALVEAGLALSFHFDHLATFLLPLMPPPWPTNAAPGNVTSGLVLVDGVHLRMQTLAPVGEAARMPIEIASRAGFFPFYTPRGQGWHSRVDHQADGRLALSAWCAGGQPQLLGRLVEPAPQAAARDGLNAWPARQQVPTTTLAAAGRERSPEEPPGFGRRVSQQLLSALAGAWSLRRQARWP